jgi:uncharacterized protein (TIGR02301 family)
MKDAIMRLTAALAALLIFATPALAQERDPGARQVLVDLAYVLGQAHALRQVCEPGDQHWRTRMLGLVEAEGTDRAFAERLRGQFNAGYVAGQAQFNACTPEARKAETQAASRGAALASRMSQARVPLQPDSLAQSPRPG